VEAQIDWYEAYADLAGERTKLQVFAMRSMASGAAFHCAYLHATQQAFLEAHELAFAYFGGVFRKLRYDKSHVGCEEDTAWIAARGDGAFRCAAIALGDSKRSFARRRNRMRRAALKGKPDTSVAIIGAGTGSGGCRRSESTAPHGVPERRTSAHRWTGADCWGGSGD